MILRRLQEMLGSAPRKTKSNNDPNLLELLANAQRFVFKDTAALACKQIAEYPETLNAARSHLAAPYPDLWIEIGDADAFLWHGKGENALRQGGLFTFHWPSHAVIPKFNMVEINLDEEHPGKVFDFLKGAQERARRLPVSGEWVDAMLFSETQADASAEDATLWLMASWALLSSKTLLGQPRVADLTKLNAQRAKKGLLPLLNYSEVRLNLDAAEAVKAKHAAGVKGLVAQHSVRAHLRMTPNAKIALVRPHLRGNPERGTVTKSYVVTGGERLMR